MPNLLGTNPNQTPTVGDLGSMAFQDENAVNIGGGLVQADLTGNSWNQNTDISTVQPTLRLDFDKMFALDPRITFGRASTASVYDGKTFAVAEHNLALWSEQFDNAVWFKSSISVVANAHLAPDGTMTADAIVESATSAEHATWQNMGGASVSGQTYTLSGYVKANGRTKVCLQPQFTAVLCNINYDLTAVTATLASGSGSGTITAVGNGWYRITATITATGSGNGYHQFNLLDSGGSKSYTGDGASGVFVWGFQVEQRSAVSAYTPTTSSAITNYIPQLMTAAANQARFDFDPITGECKGLLVEEKRTNLLVYASDYTNAVWTKSNVTIAANTIIAPDGTLTGSKITETTAASVYHQIYTTVTVASGTAYTFSVYAKAGERGVLTMYNQVAGAPIATFNLLSGVITQLSGSSVNTITPVGNGWYRCAMTVTSTTTGSAYFNIQIYAGDGTYTGNGSSGLYIWGAQLEAGSFATSYIPTTSAQVTRSADVPVMTGLGFSGWYGNGEGTFYAETATIVPVASTNAAILSLNTGDINRMLLCHSGGASRASAVAWAFIYNGAYAVDLYMATALQNAFQKTVFAIKTGNYGLWKDSNSMLLSNAVQPLPANQMSIGTDYNGAASLNGWIKRLTYFPKRLTDAEIKEMTQ